MTESGNGNRETVVRQSHTVSRFPFPVPGWFRVWWHAVRPFAFTASVTPVLVGSAAAIYHGQFHPALFVATLAGAMAIHAGTNLVNDYYDHVRGVDVSQPIGPGGAIQQGLLSPRAVLAGAYVLFALSGALGVWLVALRGWIILLLGAAGVLAGYTYTGGPLPLGYVGLGDLVVFVFMGIVITVGTYYVQTGTISAAPMWAALPMAALVDGILVVNNLRDLDNDRAKGKRTLATMIGTRNTRLHYLGLILLTYLSIAIAVIVRALPPAALLILLTTPSAIAVWRVVASETDPLRLTLGGIRGTAQLHLKVGLLLCAGLLITSLS